LPVHVGDLELSSGRWVQTRGNIQNPVVVEIQSGHRVGGFRSYRLLLDRRGLAIGIEPNHTVALGIMHVVSKDRRTLFLCHCLPQLSGKSVTEEDIIPQNQGAGIITDKLPPDDKGLRQALRLWLFGIG
jgi:hypothetical protein